MNLEAIPKMMTQEKAEKFLRENRFPIQENMRLTARCIDGRYNHDVNMPPLARPGADAGYVMTVLSALHNLNLEIEPAKILEIVIKSAGGIGNIRIHTDSHAEHDSAGACMGCAHFRNAVNSPENYGLSQEDASILKQLVGELLEKGVRLDILEGEHGESAVFIVESSNFSLRPMSEDGTQAFVYQKILETERLRALARLISLEKAGEVLTALERASDAQLVATVNKIAAGLPVYNLTGKNGELVFGK